MSGLQARLCARTDLPERDVYAQLELWCPEIEKNLHFDKAEWRPLRPHTNPPSAGVRLRGLTLIDRQHRFDVNRRLGIPGLLQTVPLIGESLPEGMETFNDFCVYLGKLWNLAEASLLPAPPWQERFL
jgi:hypothetical protein